MYISYFFPFMSLNVFSLCRNLNMLHIMMFPFIFMCYIWHNFLVRSSSAIAFSFFWLPLELLWEGEKTRLYQLEKYHRPAGWLVAGGGPCSARCSRRRASLLTPQSQALPSRLRWGGFVSCCSWATWGHVRVSIRCPVSSMSTKQCSSSYKVARSCWIRGDCRHREGQQAVCGKVLVKHENFVLYSRFTVSFRVWEKRVSLARFVAFYGWGSHLAEHCCQKSRLP